MSLKPQVFAAFNISKEHFGAAQYDSVTHVLSIAKIVKIASGLELHSLIKQVMADVVLQSNNNCTTVYSCNIQQLLQDIASIYGQVQEIVSISTQAFDFSLAEKMLFNARSDKNGNVEVSELQNMLLDKDIDQRFVLINKISVECAGALISYLEESGSLPSKCPVHVKQFILKSFMLVDSHVQNYLQVFEAKDHPNMHFQGQRREGMSLFRMLDKTKSPGGRLMLENWISAPLQRLSEIQERQQVISLLAANANSSALFEIQKMLSKVRSVRVVCQRIQTELLVGDLECLAKFAYSVVKLYSTLGRLDSELPFIQQFLSIDQDCFSMLGSLIIEIVDFEASHSEDRVVIAAGVNNKIDYLRDKFENLDDTLGEASNNMEVEAGVPVVAVYFPQLGFLSSIDIAHFSNDQLRVNIDDWSLKFQTDKQRYYKNTITSILDRSPGDIFSLIVDAESEVSLELQNKICQSIREIARAYELISQLDCLQALAELAKTRGYCQPQFNTQGCIHIQQGRHPILEYTEDTPTSSILPNDIHLSSAHCNHRVLRKSAVNNNLASAMVLMGPNASGKSVMLKQTALIVYMAHLGCHVPADNVVIGVTRQIMAMGSVSESLTQGTSALSADLKTVGKILDTAESDTLVLLDEFGRGTTPVDGMGLLCGALASLTIHRPVDKRPCVLAVTHFQEIRNLRSVHELWEHIQLKEMKFKEGTRGLVHLYKMGDYEHESYADSIGNNGYVAYAIACARDAGISGAILCRAKQLFDSGFL